MTTLGMQRNNPWDLLPEHVPWFGLAAAQPDTGPLDFVTLEDGIRAGIRLCYTYQERGWNSPVTFITRFAPPPNPTAQYIANVCEWTGFRYDQALDFHDPAVLVPWCHAIWRQEQGIAADGITDVDILSAKAMADAA
ncbi:MAG: hypothetical protein ACP5P4_05095 [Steroidobacteraceae bacterium]